MGHLGRDGGLRTPKGPHPSALSPQRLAGRPGAPQFPPLKFGVGLWDEPAGPVGWPYRGSGLWPGWRGNHRLLLSLSSACPEGLYGEDCQHSCLCQNGGSCDPVSGHCTCTEGWAGLACEKGECQAGRGEALGVWGHPRPLPWPPPSEAQDAARQASFLPRSVASCQDYPPLPTHI